MMIDEDDWNAYILHAKWMIDRGEVEEVMIDSIMNLGCPSKKFAKKAIREAHLIGLDACFYSFDKKTKRRK